MVNRWGPARAVAGLIGCVVLVATPLTAIAAGADTGGDGNSGAGVTFGIQPAQSSGRDARPDFSWGATPGATLQDHVALVNYSNRPLPLSVYPTDAINTDEGGFGLLPGDQKPTDVGAWITMPKGSDHVTVPARSKNGPGEVVFPMSVAVPLDATPGDHSGGILAVLTTTSQDKQGANVKLEQRVGTRVFVRVAGDVKPGLSVSNVKVDYHDNWNPIGRGSATVSFTVTNTGNVNVGAHTAVGVDGIVSDSSATGASVALLLVGNSVDMTIQVPDVLPQFLMSAKVTVTPVVSGADASTPHEPVTASAGFWAIPWALLAVLLLVILLAVGGRWLRNRRKLRSVNTQSPDLAELSGGVNP